MDDQDKQTVGGPTMDAATTQEDPPAYSKYTDEESQELPVPYASFPSTMQAYYQWSPPAMKTFFLCGASKDDRLYAVQTHAGYRKKSLLGTRPGLILHNGKSSKDPILAAAGEEPQRATSTYEFNLNSVIQLPPLQPGAGNFTTEIMRGAVTDDHVAAFHFAIEVGADGKMVREEFEWRKLKKGNDDVKGRGFKLVRLGPGSNKDPNQELFSSTLSPPGGETVALLEWPKGLSSLVHVFSLQLKGSGESNTLGQRWALMVVMTALRLWWLNVGGRTNTAVIGKGEEIHSNQSVP
ncbi:hypothetical protein EMPG_14574 [Blastomyces silverae]|uniref:Uncharacterized protein n=1 Tax=Blastomyces silverae TaxID=2060906 RepID=A0A0H1BFZ2_9EURO|nr:hypothetical protein EMPG_14574 [Blastomyces silverae]